MKKQGLIKLKNKLLTFGLTTMMVGTLGCVSKKNENGVPKKS